MKLFDEQKTLTVFALGLIGALVFVVMKGLSMAVPFLIALMALPYILNYYGYGYRPMGRTVSSALMACKDLFLIIALMGITIGLWIFSGVIPAMITFSTALLAKVNIVWLCFFASSCFAFVIGTPLGTISTFGIALLAVGKSMGVPEELLLGAVISGSFLADRISPMAGLVNLNLSVHSVTYSAFLKASWKRVAIAFALASILFYISGTGYDGGLTLQTEKVILAIADQFVVGTWMLGVPIFVIVLSLLKMPIRYILSLIAACCSIIALLIQGETLSDLTTVILWGYKASNNELAAILKGGGLIPFLEVIIIVAAAISLSTLLEMTKTYARLSQFFLKQVNDLKSLRLQLGLMSIALTSVTCDQTIGIITPAKLYADKSKTFGFLAEDQAAGIADTGVVVAPLEPWNVNALVIAAMTGMTVFDYGPKSYFLLLLIGIYFLESILMPEKRRTPSRDVL